MFQVYDNWPQIAQDAYDAEFEPLNFDNIDHLVFVGMGGSGTIGDLIYSIFSKSKIRVTVVKGYHLPKEINESTMIIANSVSGNTIETLTMLKNFQKIKCKIIAASSGGKIENFCKKNKIDYFNIPKIHSPRASFPAFAYSILKICDQILPITNSGIKESLKKMNKLKTQISSDNLSIENPSLDLALWLKEIPLIYYPWGLESAAIRFKNSLQENSKIHVIAEDVVEACHNGIVSWEKKSKVQPIMLRGKDDYSRTKKNWKIMKEYFELNKIDYKEIFSVNGNILSKIICLIYLLDYCSIYLASLRKVDPSPVKSIEFFKKRL